MGRVSQLQCSTIFHCLLNILLSIFSPQVIRWIQSAEGMLTAGFTIPGCLADAEQLKKEHEQFQTAIEVRTHSCRDRDSFPRVRPASEKLFLCVRNAIFLSVKSRKGPHIIFLFSFRKPTLPRFTSDKGPKRCSPTTTTTPRPSRRSRMG